MLEDIKHMSSEEKANSLTHLVSLALATCVVYPLLRMAVDKGIYALTGTVLFLVGMLMMFCSSAVYHVVLQPVRKARMRVVDHIAIYVMIAGSYSLICLHVVGGRVGWSLFIFLWSCVIVGIIGKVLALGKFPQLSLILYLAMGWVALLILRPMWLNMPHSAFWWIVAEGVFYTVGAYFFHGDEQHAYWHAIWHVFITLGALCHTIATWIILC